jgi:hypothetical protein
LSTIHEFGADLDLETLQFKTWAKALKSNLALNAHFIYLKWQRFKRHYKYVYDFSTSYDGSKVTEFLFTERLVFNGMTALKLSVNWKVVIL